MDLSQQQDSAEFAAFLDEFGLRFEGYDQTELVEVSQPFTTPAPRRQFPPGSTTEQLADQLELFGPILNNALLKRLLRDSPEPSCMYKWGTPSSMQMSNPYEWGVHCAGISVVLHCQSEGLTAGTEVQWICDWLMSTTDPAEPDQHLVRPLLTLFVEKMMRLYGLIEKEWRDQKNRSKSKHPARKLRFIEFIVSRVVDRLYFCNWAKANLKDGPKCRYPQQMLSFFELQVQGDDQEQSYMIRRNVFLREASKIPHFAAKANSMMTTLQAPLALARTGSQTSTVSLIEDDDGYDQDPLFEFDDSCSILL